MISVLMPSRKRLEMAREAINSLGNKCEVLVCIDPDDDIEGYEELKSKRVRLFVAPEQWGYANLHEYYNLLASKSKGDFLMLGNDDMLMETPDWTDKLAEFDPTHPLVINPWNPQDNLFPIITRAWYEATGHFALNTHADSWVQQVADIDGRSVYVPGIKIKHYGEELNDPTHTAVREVVRQTSEAYRRMGEQRLEDARKISDYIKEREDAINNQV